MVRGKFMGKVIGTALAATMVLGGVHSVHADAHQAGFVYSSRGTSASRVLIADHTENYSSWCFYPTEAGIYHVESKILTDGCGNQYIDPEVFIYWGSDAHNCYMDDDSLDGENFSMDVHLEADRCYQVITRAPIYHGRSLGYYQVDINLVLSDEDAVDEEIPEDVAPDYGMPDIDEENTEDEEIPEDVAPDYGMPDIDEENTEDEQIPEEVAPDYSMPDIDEENTEDEEIPEDVAPDYGMPEFDEDITNNETIESEETEVIEETADEETPVVEETTTETIVININIESDDDSMPATTATTATTTATASAPSVSSSAPATMVAGVSRSPVEQFVDRLYSVALNRAADVDGRAYWVDMISNQRESGSKVARGFIFSTEFIGRDLDNEEFVETLYSVFFNRVATDDEIDNWVDALEAGASRSAVVNGFAASEEWANSCEAYGVTK